MVLSEAPYHLTALQGAAEIEFQHHDPHAQANLERILSLDPDEPTAHAMLGVLAFERRDCPTAIQYFAKATPNLGQNNLVLWQYGQCLFQVREAEDAAQIFRQLLNLDPTNEAVRFNLALSLFEANLYPETIDTLTPLATGELPEPGVFR